MSGRTLDLLTPEGVPLSFQIASPGERIAAYLADLGLSSAIALVLASLGQLSGVAEVWALMSVLGFVVRVFYFPWFEHRWQGRTPGKRWQGLHVIDPRGEEYTAENVRHRLSVRDFMQDLRDTGVQTGGPSGYGPADKRAFADALDRTLTRRMQA